ncbi:FtsX-like permease family protein [candidate division KSB1 bacterium]|nr:MAG: FtsX-like permease family protein [candidate division KSB1 bacterium]MCE7942216.1 hypothetical protein [Chlorobi bacterium CHB1]
MIFSENLDIALSAIRASKLRSSLTLLGVIIGVMTIIGMQAIVGGFQRDLEKQLTVLGANTFQIQKFPAIITSHEQWRRYQNRKDLREDELDAVMKYATLAKSVSGEHMQFGGVVRYQDRKTTPTIMIVGVTSEYLDNNGYLLRNGRFVNPTDEQYSAHMAVLGHDLIGRLFPFEDPVGREIRVDAERFLIVGALEEKGRVFGNSQDNLVMIPLSTFEKIYGSKRSMSIQIQAPSASAYETTVDQVTGILRAIRKVLPGAENDFEIFSSGSLIETANKLTSVAGWAGLIIAAISLIVAGVGIMNIMLVSVTERTREIGIRKALGAKRREILVQFLIEAIVLCEIGGVIGIFFGIGVAQIFKAAFDLSVIVPIGSIILALVFCSLVGLFFGIYPAAKASRLDPIEALRYE